MVWFDELHTLDWAAPDLPAVVERLQMRCVVQIATNLV